MRKKKSNMPFFLLVSILVFSCLLNGLFGYYIFSLKIKKELAIKDRTIIKDASTQKENIKMPCKKMKNPLVIVVGCINYQTKEKADLPGTKVELDKIISLFKNVYKYKVASTYVKDRPETWTQTRKSILAFCKQCKEDIKERLKNSSDKPDGIIFVYSGHGESNTILASDGKQVNLNKIKEIFDLEGLPEMVGKPKVFLFSKCRGPSIVEPVKINGRLHHPEEDFLEVYSNVDNCQIKDNPPDGAFLIHEFADWLTNVSILRKLDLTDFLRIINNNVQYASKHTELVVQHVKTGYKLTLEPNDMHQQNHLSPSK